MESNHQAVSKEQSRKIYVNHRNTLTKLQTNNASNGAIKGFQKQKKIGNLVFASEVVTIANIIIILFLIISADNASLANYSLKECQVFIDLLQPLATIQIYSIESKEPSALVSEIIQMKTCSINYIIFKRRDKTTQCIYSLSCDDS